jgi:hypothetical protein
MNDRTRPIQRIRTFAGDFKRVEQDITDSEQVATTTKETAIKEIKKTDSLPTKKTEINRKHELIIFFCFFFCLSMYN